MLISVKHRLVILAMPKCASTSLETALTPRMDIITRGQPPVKHTTMRKYERFVEPYLRSFTKEPFEVISLMRDPVDWLHSWWRYRSRDSIPNPENSTGALDWSAFVEAYLDGERKPADVGRQTRFLSRKDGSLGADVIFRHEHLGAFVTWLQDRIRGSTIDVGHENRSPQRPSAPLPPTLSQALRAELAHEYEIYETLAR